MLFATSAVNRQRKPWSVHAGTGTTGTTTASGGSTGQLPRNIGWVLVNTSGEHQNGPDLCPECSAAALSEAVRKSRVNTETAR